MELYPLPQNKSADLIVEGARQNNLKNISLRIPHNQVTAITGVSGSGKSSLAFDTLFAEGQWRYVESLSTYARMFLDKVNRPDVDRLINVRPAIAIEQKNPIRTARSTVGTTTEIADLLRLLFAKIGHPVCPDCAIDGAQLSPRQRRRRPPEPLRQRTSDDPLPCHSTAAETGPGLSPIAVTARVHQSAVQR